MNPFGGYLGKAAEIRFLGAKAIGPRGENHRGRSAISNLAKDFKRGKEGGREN